MQADLGKVIGALGEFYAREGVLFDKDLGERTLTHRTVGEEELGNLRGVKALFRDHKDIDGFISIDGLGISRAVNQSTGSHRYEMIFTGPGGHSFQEFGLPSAIHAMGRAIAKISELKPPDNPKTTFTV